jgi:hypothetical protein
LTEEGQLSEELLAFIRQHIHSVEQLEMLLLVRREKGDWTPEKVSEEMRTALPSAFDRLADLEQRGLLVSHRNGTGPAYRYAPKSGELEQIVSSLADAYAERKYTIIDLIFSKPIDKIRVFANAFRLRRDEDDGER